jgi:hypothetical protein
MKECLHASRASMIALILSFFSFMQAISQKIWFAYAKGKLTAEHQFSA